MIGYYVHHHGRGHVHRAESIARGFPGPVVVLSSLPAPDENWFEDWIVLPRDDEGGSPLNSSANGQLHWVPRHDGGLRERMSIIAAWVARARPAAVVVDVSVEATLYLRLMGLPVVVIAQPGERYDAPHQLAYAVAERIIAPWPREVYSPSWLTPYLDKTSFVGAWSRYCERERPDSPAGRRSKALVLAGAGGTTLDEGVVQSWARRHPEIEWTTAGVTGGPWLDDPWEAICAADVVITHAGQNAVADVAAARRPAIVVPEERPHGEQIALARALDEAGIVTALAHWPDPVEWPALIRAAVRRGPAGWDRWIRPDAAHTAARLITEVAYDPAPGPSESCV